MSAAPGSHNKPFYLLLTLEFPPFKGGIANYLFGLCNNIPDKNIIVLAPRVKDSLSFDKTVDFKIKRVPTLRLRLKYTTSAVILFTFGLYTLLMIFSGKTRGIICNHFVPLGILGYLMKKCFGIPYELIFHGRELSKLPKKGFTKWLSISIIKEAEKFIVNSNYTKGELTSLNMIDEKNVVILNPGIEFSRLNALPALSRDGDISFVKGKEVLLTVARLVPHKGIDMVIRSLRPVINKIPNLIYIVVGEGEDRKRLESIVDDEGLNDYVVFLGNIPNEEIVKYYQICNVFLLVSREIEGEAVEGFGIVFLEANAYGKPVIGGNSGGVSSAVIDGKTGFLVDPCDPLMISSKIIELLGNKDLANRLGMQGRLRVERLFDWNKRGREIEYAISLECKARQLPDEICNNQLD